MNLRRAAVLALTLALAGIVTPASPAAAAGINEKLAVMSTWSQPTAGSYNTWNAARQNQAAWASYAFDWSTDYCSTSPDQPLGFDFRLSCQRHDFGYRNYKAVGQFPANKSRIDSAFYFDLKAKCATYNAVVRPACTSLAWTYYQAVSAFGSLASVSAADLQRAADIKQRAEVAAAQAR
ncbi:phospholipase [Dactylosporangium sp. NPDC005555]|uniref:phospholipase n=1 Tax=Dactylosporangium sp. NPDC005555 TaxID=3154889 RepID=UPI0033BB3E3F